MSKTTAPVCPSHLSNVVCALNSPTSHAACCYVNHTVSFFFFVCASRRQDEEGHVRGHHRTVAAFGCPLQRLEGTHECPDYRSAGSNSCFFDKSHTSIWVDYYLTVVASNSLGNATSDIFKVDVMEIVKPDAPQHVTLTAEDRTDSPSLHVSWEHPPNVDAGSGWVTPEYRVRAGRRRQAGDAADWKEYKAGAQTHFTLYGVHPGAAFAVQVRCRLDHGSWSSWSDASYAEIPERIGRDGPFWTSLWGLSGFLFLAAVCVAVTKRKSVMQFLLPPVPGPKIRGLDFQLVKSARPEDFAGALLIRRDFPPAAARKDGAIEPLIVSDVDAGVQPRSGAVSAGFGWDNRQKNNGGERNATREDGDGRSSTRGGDADFETRAALESDYSRVKDVTADNIFLLDSADVPRAERLPEDRGEAANGKTLSFRKESVPSERRKKLPPARPPRAARVIDGGYVDAIPTSPLGETA
ncbi:prolactin receptor b isoform X2 [Hippocampus comes]|uniref:prolactin receptor b isoform X2 n=1 Tax=Hippocampus comes TaxID=109280 RepID=UPI00094E2DFD|nr:PREDICTED: prolactin receptor-like isoform X2 [Hippocampus comes]